MNVWGLPVSAFDALEDGFGRFLKEQGNTPKSEYYLPTMVNEQIKKGIPVKVIPSHDKWYGVTYKEDKQSVMTALKQLTDEGYYEGL